MHVRLRILAFLVGGGCLTALPGATAAATRTASCTEQGITWRATFTVTETGIGPAVVVIGLQRTQGTTTSDASGMTWELRWERPPADFPAPTPPAVWPGSYPSPFLSARGTLSSTPGVGQLVMEYFSPRLVTPDGLCTIYLSPFARNGGQATWPKVAVLGDDLLLQLNDSAFNTSAFQGYVESNLNGDKIRTEVEGQTGRRWVDATSAGDPLVRADGWLMDEYLGLSEHDVDGFVFNLGVRDALDIAAAATAADRSARVDALYGRLSTVVPRMAERTGCLQVITIPEHASSLDPDYAAAAVAVNNFFRFFAVAGGTADVLDVVDFAERARSHRYPGPDAWFGPDNVHLNEVGRLVLTATITEAARRCTHTTLAYGRAGSFSGPLATKTRLPTGQSFATRAVPGWEFLPGRDIYLSTTAADGTFFAGTMNQMGNATIGATGDSMVIGAFHPDSNSFTNIRLKTDKGRETVYGMPLWQPRAPHAGDIGDLEAFNGGTAIAFTNAAPGSGFQNPDVDGYWPVFGILTKGPNGWGVAEGRDAQGNVWRNQWTPNQLVAGSRNQAAALKACGVLGPLSGDARDCRSLQEITVLPHSGDIIITQYFGDDSWSGQLVVLDVDPDPAIPGRFRVEVAEVFDVPVIPDPAQDNPAIHLWIAPLTVNVDPTSTPDDERFVMLADTVYKRVGTNDVLDGHHPKTVIEFSYNEHATGHKIRPVSAPVLTGDLSASPEPAPPAGDGLRRFAGLGYATYDAAGNLWASVGHGFDGMATVVWAKGPNGRRLSNGTCAFNGGLEGYELNLAGVKPAWAVRCDPDYRILQTETLNSFGLWFDSVTGNMVTSNGSTLQAIQAEGSGSEMRFRVSNVASTVSQAIAARTGPCPGHPEIASCTTFTVPGQAPTDRAGRSFSILSQYVPRELRNAAGGAIDPLLRLDQWVFSTDQTRLFGRSGPRLTTQPGGATVVEAEQTSTYDTTQIASGKTKLVDSKAFFVSCGGCGYAAPAPTSGFALGDRSGGGVRAETEVTYALVVPKAGRYRLSYRATDLGAAGTRRIRVRVDGTTIDVTTPITPDSMADVPGPVIALPAGTSTLRLSVPDAASAGWQLDRMTFTRQ